MENEELVTITETENSYYEDDFTASDYVFIFVAVFLACGILWWISKLIKDTFSKFHVKLGDKMEIGFDTSASEKEKKEETKNN